MISSAWRRIVPLTTVLLAAACGGGAGEGPGASAPAGSAPAASPSAPPAREASAGSAGSARPPGAPALAPKRPVVREYFGTKVTDDYEWLEDGKSAETRAFVDAQNAYARGILDKLPERPKVRARVAELLGQSSPDYRAVEYAAGTLFVLVDQPPKQQPLLVTRDAAGDASSQKVVLDPNALDPSGATTIDFFVPSPDGKLVAVSLSKGGTESGDVHVVDAATGKERGDVIARVNGGTAGGSVAWNESGSGFYYTRYPRKGERPDPDLDFYQQVYFHKLGDPESKDVYAIGKDFPRIAEVELSRSDDGKTLLATVANGDGGEFEHFVLAKGEWLRIAKLEDAIVVAKFGADGKIYAVSRKGAPRGKVVVFAPPFDKPPVEVVPQDAGVIEDVVATKGALYLVEIEGGPSAIKRTALSPKAEPLARERARTKTTKRTKKGSKGGGKASASNAPVTIPPGERGVPYAELPILPVSNVSGVVRVGEDLLVRDESFVEPPAWYRYEASAHRMTKTSLAKAPAADMSDVLVVRDVCKSKDGTEVPVTILRPKTAKLDGTLPALLTGYGGFGVSVKPRLRVRDRVWLDAGGVVAVANLRGGGEMGEEWHRAGSLTKKQNVFDDFAACAKTLFDRGYTRPARLAITGRSNGGLLMGAEIVQHPEMFRAVVSGVGIYDMLRTELSPNGAFNVTEYGTVKDEADFRALRAYSPLHNVEDGTAYPAILLATGANDPRVDPYHSRKMLARLQAATSSDRPILLRASNDTGHGMGSPLSAEIEEAADELSFLLHEVGAPFPAAK
jgi:prolyl oligopeptidase